jgi:ABC-2 type transport system ATP-binding protein
MKINLENVNKTLSKKEILKNISFSFSDGEIVGFIGNNGAGKTTTIKTIFQEYKLNEGRILCDGKTIQKDDLKKMEFFPEQNNFPKHYKVKDYCKYNYFLSNPTKSKEEFEELFIKLIDALNLIEYKNATFSKLSSGMQKRALLLFVLINQPKILVLDEPTSNLDVQSRKEFISLLKTLATDLGLTILITSHNIDELEKFVNKIVFINNGEIILERKYDSSKEKLTEIYNKYFQSDKEMIDNKKLTSIFAGEKNEK